MVSMCFSSWASMCFAIVRFLFVFQCGFDVFSSWASMCFSIVRFLFVFGNRSVFLQASECGNLILAVSAMLKAVPGVVV